MPWSIVVPDLSWQTPTITGEQPRFRGPGKFPEFVLWASHSSRVPVWFFSHQGLLTMHTSGELCVQEFRGLEVLVCPAALLDQVRGGKLDCTVSSWPRRLSPSRWKMPPLGPLWSSDGICHAHLSPSSRWLLNLFQGDVSVPWQSVIDPLWTAVFVFVKEVWLESFSDNNIHSCQECFALGIHHFTPALSYRLGGSLLP